VVRYDNIAVFVGADDVGQGGEGAHVEPLTVESDGVDVLGLFHNGKVNAYFGQFYKPFLKAICLSGTVPIGLYLC